MPLFTSSSAPAGNIRNWKPKRTAKPAVRSDDSAINLGDIKCYKCKRPGAYNSLKRFIKLKTRGPCKHCIALNAQRPTSMKSSDQQMHDPSSPKNYVAPKEDIEGGGGGEAKN